ncbi:hypothetical protein BH11ARM2_BH11ARM2_09480 [soil metagenome]
MTEVDPQVEALYEAAGQGDIPKMRELLDSGVSVSALSEYGTALGNASAHGQEDAVRFLLERGAPIDQVDEGDDTALFFAAGKSMSMFNLLVSAGADPLKETTVGRTALRNACYESQTEVAKHLLELGIDPNLMNDMGQNALHAATMLGPCSPDLIRLLLDAGTSVNVQDAHGFTPLHHMARKGQVEAMRMLLQTGANPDLKCGVGGWKDLPIDLARQANRTEVVNILAPITGITQIGPDSNNPSALINAAKEGDIDTTERLVDAGVDVDTAINNTTALLSASLFGHTAVVKLLLEKGANPNYANSDGNTPLYWAIDEDFFEVASLLLKHGANPKLANNSGSTALHPACAQRDVPMVTALLDAGADPNAVAGDTKRTPLHCALDRRIVAIERKRAGEDVERTSEASGEIVRQFVKRGLKMDVKNDGGWTPLHLAIASGDVTAVEELLYAGASLDVKATENGYSPFDLARDSICPIIEELLNDVKQDRAQTANQNPRSALAPPIQPPSIQPSIGKASSKPGCMVIGALFVCAFGVTAFVNTKVSTISPSLLRLARIKQL